MVKIDQSAMKIKQKNKCKEEDSCCKPEEPVVETAEVPAASSKEDWQKEERPYYHREIF